MALNITTEPLPGSQLRIRVEADEAEVEKAYDRVFSQLSQEARIPGFRPGKAPRAILERRFDADTLRRLAWEEFLEKSWLPALEALKIRPYGEPEMPDLDNWDGFRRGQPLDLSLTWTVYPRPILPDYLSLKLLRPSTEVTEEDIEARLQDLLKAHAKRVPVDRDTVQEGDLVSAYVTVFRPESEDILDEYQGDLTAHADREDPISKAIIGARKGSVAETTLRLGADQADPELAGKEVRVKIRVQEIQEEVLPELDAEFARQVEESLESVEELRDWVRERLREDFEREAERAVRDAALAVVNARTELDLPPAMVRDLAGSQLERYAREMMASGVSADRIRQLVSDRESGITEALVGETITGLRLYYILDAIAEEQRIEVSEEDVERAVAEYAERHGIDANSLRQMVMMQPETEEEFRRRARDARVVDLLVAHAEIEEVPREGFPARLRRLLEEQPAGEGEPAHSASEVEPALAAQREERSAVTTEETAAQEAQ